MLSSPRKIAKLFIKFVMWGNVMKAEKLLLEYPECVMPWQKAFEEASKNKSISACRWLVKNAQLHDNVIDIHYKNDEVIDIPCKFGYLDTLREIISWDKAYPWYDVIIERIANSPYKDKFDRLLNEIHFRE
jgi:hypothetical protein